jgi:hypothetical protein
MAAMAVHGNKVDEVVAEKSNEVVKSKVVTLVSSDGERFDTSQTYL